MMYSKRKSRKISTHTSRVGCDGTNSCKNIKHDWISTHTSRVGCDSGRMDTLWRTIKFLLTHPVWDVTETPQPSLRELEISTHTSRVGCDGKYGVMRADYLISTHTSRVGCDRNVSYRKCIYYRFLLTHPVWDVTRWTGDGAAGEWFLLTHPVWDVTVRTVEKS